MSGMAQAISAGVRISMHGPAYWPLMLTEAPA